MKSEDTRSGMTNSGIRNRFRDYSIFLFHFAVVFEMMVSGIRSKYVIIDSEGVVGLSLSFWRSLARECGFHFVQPHDRQD